MNLEKHLKLNYQLNPNNNKPEMKEILEYAIDAAIIIIGALLANDKVKTWWRKCKRKFYPHDVATRAQIKQAMDTLRIKLGATRVNLWMFNNGVESFNGFCFKFVSLVYESHDERNTNSIKHLFKNCPVEDYLELVERIHHADKFYYDNRNSDLPIVRSAYDQFGLHSGIDYKLNNKEVYHGFISVGFSGYTTPTPEMIKEIESATALINSLIKKLKK